MSKRSDNYIKSIQELESKIDSIKAEYDEKIKVLENAKKKKISGLNERLKFIKSKLEAEENNEKVKLVKDLPLNELHKLLAQMNDSKASKKEDSDDAVQDALENEVATDLSFERREIGNEQI